MSTMDDTINNSEEDFSSLMIDYYEGSEIENEFPEATLVSKKLFEEDDVLCGEIVLEFPTLSAAHLYQHKGIGPLMYCLSCYSIDSEYFSESNGEFGGDVMPVIFWEEGTKKLELKTDVTVPDETTVSLVDNYRTWKAGH
jgi:hypothetical protein